MSEADESLEARRQAKREYNRAYRAAMTPERVAADREYKRTYMRKYREPGNPAYERTLEEQRIKRTGFTDEMYNARFVEQDGKCAICGADDASLKRGLHRDHDHTTKSPRGLLCTNCNTGIGLMQDDLVRLQSAINYLSKWAAMHGSSVLPGGDDMENFDRGAV